jgi:CheY-like chemotaxis protein
MQQPLVLAIEPDVRQAAIVKRIVREKVLADVAVVDSRDAALEAMRTTVPDVLLLSALLSPRDEDELVAHLRTRRDAEHLQTHTIPQLASAIGGGDEPPSRGLLSAFRRRKSGSAPAGCDPDLFAEEIKTYLKRASEKKREARSTGPAFDGIAATPPSARPTAAAAEPSAVAEPPAASSWSSPFEWRPSREATPAPPLTPAPTATPAPPPTPAVEAAPAVAAVAFEPPAVEPPAVGLPAFETAAFEEPGWEPPTFEPPALEPAAFDAPASEPAAFEPAAFEPPAVESPAFEPAVFEAPAPEPLSMVLPLRPAVRYPLTMRTVKGWWFVEGKEDAQARAIQSDLHGILSNLSVPLMIASVAYADGCHIRRVRLAAA